MMRKKTVIFIILFVLHISISWNAYADIIPDERAALTDFYNSTDGANWIRQWDTDPSVKVCGNWEGVTCDGNEEHVIGLVLEYNNLKGSIPDTIEKLTDLMGLHLRNNNLEGSVPSGLYNLRNLQVLDLQANNLTGNISDQLNNMTSLIQISLTNNQLAGNIPLSDKLTQLELLDLSNNEFTGTIPGELGNLRSLTDIRLYNNRLEGAIPPELSNLNSLKILYLEGNNLTGSIPKGLGELGSLEELSLARNRLTGNIPPEFGNLSELQVLELATNQLTGNIPSELGKLTKLTKLTIADNALTGEIPSELMQLENLQDGGSTFEGNALHTSDPDLLVFLGKKQDGSSDWESTQTLAPTKLETASVTHNTITLTWPRTNYGGGYLIFYKTGSEEFDPIIIDDIKIITAQVKDLQPSTEYVLKMQTVTQRSQGESEITVFSDFTDEISVTTNNDEDDTTKPFNTGIIINNGDESTVSNDVTLSIKADDNVGVTGYSVSEDSSPGEYLEITPATPQFTGEIPFTLSSGYGEKTVYVWFKDDAGNVSEPALDTIELKEYADFEINIKPVTQRTEGDNLYLDVEFTGTAPEETEVEWYPGGEENYCGYAGEDYVFSPLVFAEDPSPMTFSPVVSTFKVTIDASSWIIPGEYLIRLKLKDNVGEPEGNHSNIAESDFFKIEKTGVNNKPETPTIVSPVNDEVFTPEDSVTLQAGTFSDPDSDEHYSSYWYIKKEDGDVIFDGEITKDDTDDLTKYTLSELYSGYRYIWKVKYGDSKIFSEWSDEGSFIVESANSPPDKPEAQSPSNDQTVDPEKPLTLQAGQFSDSDGDEHYSSYWHIEKDDGHVIFDGEITKNDTDDLTKYTLSELY
ncbi:MAG: hypothetical protein GY795_23870, partial [Desulfobacterales bacterium]|nr:hypothetical protein [Desulfobacterales bacterium]